MHATDADPERRDAVLPSGFTAYYGADRFVLLSPTYVTSESHPYCRLSHTLLIGCRGPFRIALGQDLALDTRAVLIAPGVLRRRVEARDSDLAILDFSMHTAEFERLKERLDGRQTLELDHAALAPLLPALWEGYTGALGSAEFMPRVAAVIDAVCGRAPPRHRLDPRIAQVMKLMREAPPQSAPALLAQQIHMSPSRLRHLFKQETGVSLRQYARSVLVWRGISLWTPGAPLTGLAHQTGAYDLAHYDRAFCQAFGRSPSSIVAGGRARIIRC